MADLPAKLIYAPVPSLFKRWTEVRDGESTAVLVQTYEKKWVYLNINLDLQI